MTWLTWLPRIVAALVWYAKELVVANVAVIVDICTPVHRSDPVVVRYPTRCRSEFEAALLSVLITLTPGTLTLATATRPAARPDGAPAHDLYVHIMFPGDFENPQAQIEPLESYLLSAVRREGAPNRATQSAEVP